MLKISSTSALVINWTDQHLYQGKKTKQYIEALDLSEGDVLLNALDKAQHFMHTQAISARKYFMLSKASAFLEDCHNKNTCGQVVIMAAGLSPLSASLAEQFPKSRIYDLDLYSMEEKSGLLNNLFSNISFIKTDLNNIAHWSAELIKNNFDYALPTLVIFEGIVYYLEKEVLINLLKWCKAQDASIIGDFCLPPELIHEDYQIYPFRVFEVIRNTLLLPPITFYSRNEFCALLNESGYKEKEVESLPEIHLQRTGNQHPFEISNSGWIDFWTC